MMDSRVFRGLSAKRDSVQAVPPIPFITDSIEEGELILEPEVEPYKPHSSIKSRMEKRVILSTKFARTSCNPAEKREVVSSDGEEAPGRNILI